MRGRKPEPTQVLKLRGSNRTKGRTAEPRGPGLTGELDPPAFFSTAARDKWRELLPVLQKMGTLSLADVDHFRAYCVAYARWQKAEIELARHGEVITHRNGVEGLSHWLKVAESALDRMSKSGAEIGLSATARPRIRATPTEKVSDDDTKARFFKAFDRGGAL